jgi:hypothetical protein
MEPKICKDCIFWQDDRCLIIRHKNKTPNSQACPDYVEPKTRILLCETCKNPSMCVDITPAAQGCIRVYIGKECIGVKKFRYTKNGDLKKIDWRNKGSESS